jgi:rhodanese-related sulfurtransferase
LGIGSIAPDALMTQIADGTAPVVLDVRSRKEFDEGHVPGARHLPFWQAGKKWRLVVPERDVPLVLYCGHGPRAYIAAATLKRRGFNRIAYLAGHMKKWKEMNLPLEGE